MYGRPDFGIRHVGHAIKVICAHKDDCPTIQGLGKPDSPGSKRRAREARLKDRIDLGYQAGRGGCRGPGDRRGHNGRHDCGSARQGRWSPLWQRP